MADVLETQLRLIYSLLKPAVRAAAHFKVPIRSLLEMVRLAYFEHLRRSGLSVTEIARTFDQTPRHMRSLAQRVESDFFEAERHVGLVREVEAFVASERCSDEAVVSRLGGWQEADVRDAIAQLLEEGRIERDEHGNLGTAQRYVVLRTEAFEHRIDAINHFFDAGFGAVLHRMVYDDSHTALLKTISFSALKEELRDFLDRLEGNLRRDLARLDESATFAGCSDERYILALGLTPVTDQSQTAAEAGADDGVSEDDNGMEP